MSCILQKEDDIHDVTSFLEIFRVNSRMLVSFPVRIGGHCRTQKVEAKLAKGIKNRDLGQRHAPRL